MNDGYLPDNDPTPGQDGRGLYVSLGTTQGKFRFQRKEDPAPVWADGVAGVFEHLTRRWDDGNPAARVPARWEAHVTLSNARATITNHDGSKCKVLLGRVELQIGAPVAFRSIAEKFQAIRSGDGIFVQPELSGREGDTTCFVSVYKSMGGDWHPVRYDSLPVKCTSANPDPKLAATEKYEQAIKLYDRHPDFVTPEGDKPNAMPEADPSPNVPAPAFSGSAEGGANPAQDAPSLAQASVDAQAPTATVKAPRAVDETAFQHSGILHTAFGFTHTRWPLPHHWTTPPTAKQIETLGNRFDQYAIPVQLRNAVYFEILRAHGLVGGDRSLATLAIVNDFLAGALPESIAAVREAADSYDPFADE